MKLKTLQVVLLLFFFSSSCQADLLVNQYNTNLHDRFSNSSQFIGNPYDWSGVGKRVSGPGPFTGRWATMVSDSFGLAVNHASPEVGSTVRFYHSNDPAGSFEDRVVAQTFSYGSADLRLIRFATAVSANVEKYTLYDTPASGAAGLDLKVFGLASANDFAPETRVRLGTNTADGVLPAGQISGINYDSLLFDYDTSEGQGEARVAGGDSGAPSFVIENNTPLLIGLHNFQYTADDGSTGSGDIFLPSYIDAINDDLAGFGESLSVFSVPEPTSGALIGIGLIGLLIRRNRRA